MIRCLNSDCIYIFLDKKKILLSGCLFMFVWNVGYLMINSVVLDWNGNEIYEGILDSVIISLIVKYILFKNGMY